MEPSKTIEGGPPISTSSGNDQRYPLIYLAISILTCLVTVTSTIVSIRTLLPEQEKIRQEIEQITEERAESKPRISVEYVYTNDEGERSIQGFDPKAGPATYKLPKRRIPDFPTGPPTRKEWMTLTDPKLCCPEVHRWLSKVSQEEYSATVKAMTQYLVIQRIGSLQADDITLAARRFQFKVGVENASLGDPDYQASQFGTLREITLGLGSLEPGHGLRVPVARFIDFSMADLYPKDTIGVTPPNELSYGVAYLPIKLSYTDPVSKKRIEENIRPPLDGRITIDLNTESGG